MAELVVTFVTPDARPAEDAEPIERSEGLIRARTAWRREVWEPYRQKQIRLTPRSIAFSIGIGSQGGRQAIENDDLEVPLDADLFESLIEIYGTYGSAAFNAAWAQRDSLSYHDQQLLGRSIARLQGQIARELIRIQPDATALALKENAELADAMKKHLDKFRMNAGYGKIELDISYDDKDALYSALRECKALQDRIEPLQGAIKELDRKDGGDRATIARKRERDRYRQLRVRGPLDARDRVIDELEKRQLEIGKLFPPALLILDELEDDLHEVLSTADAGRARKNTSRITSKEIQLKYEAKMHRVLRDICEGLAAIRTSLANPGAETTINAHLSKSELEQVRGGGLHAAVLDYALKKQAGISAFVREGVLYGLFGLYFTAQERVNYTQENRVLGSPRVLRRLLNAVEAEAPNTFRHAVLRQYVLELEGRVSRELDDQAAIDSWWHFAEMLVAAAGLLLAVLLIPFGPGAVAVPAALATFLALAGLAITVSGIVLLAGSVVSLVGQSLDAESELKRKLVSLGRDDLSALLELGGLLSRHHALVRALTSGMLQELVKLAVAHKLRPVAYALDMQGYLDDIRMLSEPMPEQGLQ